MCGRFLVTKSPEEHKLVIAIEEMPDEFIQALSEPYRNDEQAALNHLLDDRRYRAQPSRESSLQALYEQAFKDYGAQCLWNARPPLNPDGLRVIVGRLRKHGDMAAWRLANRIEEAICDAAG
jgi:hypothetical protein